MLTPVDFSNTNILVDLIASLAAIIVADTLLFYVLRRRFAVIYIVICEALLFAGFIFQLTLFEYAVAIVLTIGVVTFLFANIGEYRFLVSNSLKGKGPMAVFKKNGHVRPEPLFDREEMYKKVEAAVLILSKQKIGALITFERKDNLDDVMKNGTKIYAPVSSELLQTIFYPGTRLHDGAVIIRDDKIVAASVYYTPTSRPLTGKYGSRHRAAYGICEASDSVTVLVSEETGRISIFFQGEATTVTPDNFLRIFEEDMSTASSPDDEDKETNEQGAALEANPEQPSDASEGAKPQ
jgi:diadenylate cyclase